MLQANTYRVQLSKNPPPFSLSKFLLVIFPSTDPVTLPCGYKSPAAAPGIFRAEFRLSPPLQQS